MGGPYGFTSHNLMSFDLLVGAFYSFVNPNKLQYFKNIDIISFSHCCATYLKFHVVKQLPS